MKIMANQSETFNVNLAMTADVSQAKAQLQSIQQQLDSLTKSTLKNNAGLGLTKELKESLNLVNDLKAKLSSSVDKNTGLLDLSKFGNSIKGGREEIDRYRDALMSLGPQGADAFNQVVRSVSAAEVPIKKTHGLLKDFGTTLANTAKWQISSTIIHGIQGAFSQAIGYAKNLDSSLNNIRIVTGQSASQMAAFAQRANESAKALGTTTNEYTKASLIFYQQGLSDSDVQKRTDAVIKMSQITGDSAEAVSSYMTAIWNNFDDGTKSLESFEDVIAALGASTASSSAEIAQGLSKFSAIAKTTGLSYEYATASLATLVANTRESADTIGNSLKTVFSRLQGLKLGETLEDGVDLNKYSAALNAVGVQVLNANGDLRDMDNILEELASRWDVISDAQKMALAQTVAGTRQYSVLMSLMNNWDDMQKNLDTAKNSEGTLNKQADIYQESWEAARKRVQASMEGIYNQLVDREALTDLNNGLAGIVDTINSLVSAFGGLPGMLSMLAAGMTKAFGPQMAAGINNTVMNLGTSIATAGKGIDTVINKAGNLKNVITGKQVDENAKQFGLFGRMGKAVEKGAMKLTGQNPYQAEETKLAFLQSQKEALEARKTQTGSINAKALDEEITARQKILDLQKQMASQGKELSDSDNAGLANRMKEVELLKDEVKLKQEAANAGKVAQTEALWAANLKGNDRINAEKHFVKNIKANEAIKNLSSIYNTSLTEDGATSESTNAQLQGWLAGGGKEALKGVREQFGTDGQLIIDDLIKAIEQGSPKVGEAIEKAFQRSEERIKHFRESMIEAMEAGGKDTKVATKIATDFEQGTRQMETSAEEAKRALEEEKQKVKELEEEIERLKNGQSGKKFNLGESITGVAQGLSSMTMAVNAVKGSVSTLFDDSISGGDKFLSVLGSVTMMLPMVVSGIKSMGAALNTAFGPIGYAITAITAIGMGIFATTQAVEAAQKKRIENSRKETEELMKTSQASKEEANANSSLAGEYDRLLSVYRETKEGKEELAAAAEKVAEAYDIENQHILIQTENYEALAKAIREKRQAEVDAAKGDAVEAANSARNTLIQNANATDGGLIHFSENAEIDSEGKRTGAGTISLETGIGGMAISGQLTQNEARIQALETAISEYNKAVKRQTTTLDENGMVVGGTNEIGLDDWYSSQFGKTLDILTNEYMNGENLPKGTQTSQFNLMDFVNEINTKFGEGTADIAEGKLKFTKEFENEEEETTVTAQIFSMLQETIDQYMKANGITNKDELLDNQGDKYDPVIASIQQFLDNNSEDLSTLEIAAENQNSFIAEDTVLNNFGTFLQKFNATDKEKQQSALDKQVQEWTDIIKEMTGMSDEAAMAAVYDVLKDTELSQEAETNQALQEFQNEISDKFFKDSEEGFDNVFDWYDSLSEDEKTLFYKFKPDKSSTQADFEEFIRGEQARMDIQNAESAWGASKEGLEKFKKYGKDISEDEYKELQGLFDFGKDGLEDFGTFVGKDLKQKEEALTRQSEKKKQDYLDEMNNGGLDSLRDSAKNSRARAEYLEGLTSKFDTLYNSQEGLNWDSERIISQVKSLEQAGYDISKIFDGKDLTSNWEKELASLLQDINIAKQNAITNAENNELLVDQAENDIKFQAQLEDAELRRKINELTSTTFEIGTEITLENEDALKEMFGEVGFQDLMDQYAEIGQDGYYQIANNPKKFMDEINQQQAMDSLGAYQKDLENKEKAERSTGGSLASREYVKQAQTDLAGLKASLIAINDDATFERIVADMQGFGSEVDETVAKAREMREAMDSSKDTAENLSQYLKDELIDPEQYSQRLIQVFNNDSSMGTLDKLRKLREEILNGTGDAQTFKNEIDNLLNSDDISLDDKLTQIKANIGNEDGQYSQEEADARIVEAISNDNNTYDAQKADMLTKYLDSEYESVKAKAQREMIELAQTMGEMDVLENIDPKDLAETNKKAYMDAFTELVENDGSLSPEEQFAEIQAKAEALGIPLEYLNTEIADILNQTGTGTIDTFRTLLELLKEGNIGADTFLDQTQKMLESDDVSFDDKVKIAKEAKDYVGSEEGQAAIEQQGRDDWQAGYDKATEDAGKLFEEKYPNGSEIVKETFVTKAQNQYRENNGTKKQAGQNAIAEAQNQIVDDAKTIANNATASDFDNLKDAKMSLEALGDAGENYQRIRAEMAREDEDASKALDNYNDALRNGTYEQKKAAEQALEDAIALKDLANESKFSKKEIMALTNSLMESGSGLEDSRKLAQEVATQMLKTERGIKNLNKAFKSYGKELKSGEKNTENYAKGIEEIGDACNDIIGVDLEKYLGGIENATKFASDNMELLEKAAKGDVEAIEDLRTNAAQEIVLNATFNDLSDEAQSQLDQVMQDLQNADLSEIEVGVSIDDVEALQSFQNTMNQFLADGTMTADEVSAALNGINFDPEITEKEFQVADDSAATFNTDGTVTLSYIGADGKPITGTFPSSSYSHVEGSGNGTIKVPVINGTGTRSKGGVTSGANAGGGGGGRGGGGGGGGGRGGQARERRNASYKTRREMTQRNDDIERYHKIKNQLEDVTDAYEKVSNMADKAFGKAKLKLLDEQIKKQEKLTETNRKYAAEVQKNLTKEKQTMGKNYGAQFDENGTITNYEAMMKKQIEKRNNADKKFNDLLKKNYNALSGDAQEALDKQYAEKVDSDGNNYSGYEDYLEKTIIEPADEAYEKFKEELGKYEEDQDLYKEKTSEILESLYDEYDLLLQKTQTGIQMRINVDEDTLKFIDYLKTKIDDIPQSAYEAANKISLLGGEIDSYIDRANQDADGIGGILSNHGMNGDAIVEGIKNGTYDLNKLLNATDVILNPNDISTYTLDNIGLTQDEVDAIREYANDILDQNANMIDARNSMFETIADSFDYTLDELDTGIAKMTHFQTMTESYLSSLSILGKKRSGLSFENLSKILEDQNTQAQDILKATMNKKMTLASEIERTQAMLDQAIEKGWTVDAAKWQAELERQTEAFRDAEEEYASQLEATLQMAVDAFETAVERIIDDLKDSLGGMAGSLTHLREQFDMQKEISSEYVDDYEKVYQLSKLNRDIMKSVDESKNVRAKQDLLILQEKINELEKEGTEFSTYRLDELRKEYELQVAKNALEEAQNAKSEVRMTRDDEGNYGYVYTANNNQVAEAEQTYEDKIYELEKLNAEYINELQENMLSLEEQAAEKLQQATEMYQGNDEMLAQAMLEIDEWYRSQIEFYGKEMELATENNTWLYEEYVANHKFMTEEMTQSDQEYVSSFEETLLSVSTGYANLDEFIAATEESIRNSIDLLIEAHKNMEENMNETTSLVTSETEGLGEVFTTVVNNMTSATTELAENVAELANGIIDNYENIMTTVNNFEQEYSSKIQSIMDKNENLSKSFYILMNAWSQFNKKEKERIQKELNGDNSPSSTPKKGNNGPNTPDSGGSYKGQLTQEVIEGVAGSIWVWNNNGWGNDPERAQKLHEKFGAGGTKIQDYINAHWATDLGELHPWDYYKNFFYSKFDTGGYTGDWEGGGRMAMLHQKEIVLNKEDTENFLDAVNILREVTQAIDLNALVASGGLGNALINGILPSGVQGSETLEQEVHITAEFPNASNKDEILGAFDNVINLAAQYANRKR